MLLSDPVKKGCIAIHNCVDLLTIHALPFTRRSVPVSALCFALRQHYLFDIKKSARVSLNQAIHTVIFFFAFYYKISIFSMHKCEFTQIQIIWLLNFEFLKSDFGETDDMQCFLFVIAYWKTISCSTPINKPCNPERFAITCVALWNI